MQKPNVVEKPAPAPHRPAADEQPQAYLRRHLRFGWWSLFVFAALGLALETLQGFKTPLYVDVSSDTRRLMWTLAHAHGVGLALVHVLFAVSLPLLPAQPARDRLVPPHDSDRR